MLKIFFAVGHPVRGDGTRGKHAEIILAHRSLLTQRTPFFLLFHAVYFFTPEELSEVFGAEASSSSSSTLNDVRSSLPDEQASPEAVGESSDAGKRVKEEGEETKAGKTEQRFETVQMAVDRRLLVNRKERKRMYRVWMQAKFRKL